MALPARRRAGGAHRAEPPDASPVYRFGANACGAACLYLVCAGFAQPVTVGKVIVAFGSGTLAWMLSPVPAGVGVVEGAMTLALISLGIPAHKAAAVIAVAYRGLSFWLPMLAGAASLRRQDVTTAGKAA